MISTLLGQSVVESDTDYRLEDPNRRVAVVNIVSIGADPGMLVGPNEDQRGVLSQLG
jgi:hypothetical protein